MRNGTRSNEVISSQKQPLVSVLIPAYQAEETLARAVTSLLQQSYTNWEAVIAADDGLSYEQVLAEQGIQDARIQHTFTNGHARGAAIARNIACQHAQGDLLALLDADDAYAAQRLEQLVPLALQYGAAVDNTGVYNTECICYKRPFPGRTMLSFATAEDILSPRIPFFAVFQRKFFGQGWVNVSFAEDVLFNLELLSQISQFAIHPASLYQYYKRERSITQSATAFATAEKGYQQILTLLEQGELRLRPEIRAAAQKEFAANLRLNHLFRRYMQEERCQNLEEFLDMTENGHAAWIQPKLAALSL